MKMQHITIQSGAFDEAVKFYQEIVGLKIVGEINGPHHIAFLANGEGETAVEIIDNPDAAYEGSGISIGFTVDDVEKFRDELIEKGFEPGPMISPNPNVKFFFVKDPSGVSVQFI